MKKNKNLTFYAYYNDGTTKKISSLDDSIKDRDCFRIEIWENEEHIQTYTRIDFNRKKE